MELATKDYGGGVEVLPCGRAESHQTKDGSQPSLLRNDQPAVLPDAGSGCKGTGFQRFAVASQW